MSDILAFDDPKVKEQMLATRYRQEQTFTRLAAIKACKQKNLALELYAGTGGCTELYTPQFKKVITNDINKNSPAMFHMSAQNFIRVFLPKIKDKIDLVDFDCYGCPSEEIKQFFAERKDRDFPLVVTLSDGLGLWMKRSKDVQRIQDRYLLGAVEFDLRHPWREHRMLVDVFMRRLGVMYGAKVETLSLVQTKHMNYVLGSWLYV